MEALTDAEVADIRAHWVARVNDPPGRVRGVPPRVGFESIFDHIITLSGMAWPIQEITDQKVDVGHFRAMAPLEQQVVLRIHVLFAVADLVVEGYLAAAPVAADAAGAEETLPIEFANLLDVQKGQEVVHYYVYNNLIEQCLPPELRGGVEELAATHPAIRTVVEWGEGAMGAPLLFLRNAARTVFELIVFTAQFMVPHELKKCAKLPTFCNANERIAPDESKHAESGFDMHRAAFAAAIGTPPHVRAAANRALTRTVVNCYNAALPLFEWIYEGGAAVGSCTRDRALEYTRRSANALLASVGAEAAFAVDADGSDDTVSGWLQSIQLERTARTNFFEDDALAYSKHFSAAALSWGAPGVDPVDPVDPVAVMAAPMAAP